MLVWSSWARDPDVKRFFIRRSLRIFPGLWVAVFLTAFLLGPTLSRLAMADYFSSTVSWRYLSTAVLLVRHVLPGVFVDNPYPNAVNGSLWTLPVEFMCYVSVAAVGSMYFVKKQWLLGFFVCLVVLGAAFGPGLAGERFTAHFEMVAFFWWGVWLGYLSGNDSVNRVWSWMLTALAFLMFYSLGSRGADRTAMVLFAGGAVIFSNRVAFGARLTDRLGDLSYGMYIFAFPVQQILIESGRGRGWPFGMYLGMSFFVTAGLAYLSWHLIEKRALRFKPKAKVMP
jgi:peptidoglycan/LPS O-acetylase OafA/YrhL